VKTVHEPHAQDDQSIFISDLYYYDISIDTQYSSSLTALAQLLDRTKAMVIQYLVGELLKAESENLRCRTRFPVNTHNPEEKESITKRETH
jgi:hypothetical protein